MPSWFLGRVVRNSIGFAFHRYNEIFILEMRLIYVFIIIHFISLQYFFTLISVKYTFSGSNRFFFGHEVAKNYLKHMPTNKTNLCVFMRDSTTPKSLGKCTVSSGHSLLARTSDPLLCPSAHKGSACRRRLGQK